MTYKRIPSIQQLIRDLRTARVAKGLSQRVLARQMGIPQSHLSKIESGRVNITLASAIEMARGLDLEIILAPRQAITAVRGLLAAVADPQGTETQQPAYTVDNNDEGDTDA